MSKLIALASAALLVAGCATATEPLGDRATRNGFGGWDVVLSNRSSCSLLAADARTAEQAIATCRRWLGMAPQSATTAAWPAKHLVQVRVFTAPSTAIFESVGDA